MPQKIYRIENLCCANCAAKIEEAIRRHPQVEAAAIVFPTRQLRLTAMDPDALIPQLTGIARKIEGEVTFLPREEDCAFHEEGCACGHDHHSHASHGEEGESSLPIWIGAGLFVLGLVLEALKFRILGFAPAPVVFVCAYLLLGLDVLDTALQNLGKGRMLDENFLMGIATVGAFLIGEFPEAVGVMLFYRIGEYFEEKAVSRSRSQILSAIDLRPESVNLVTEDGTVSIPAAEAKVGDVLLVRPGDRIPVDGVVLSGDSRLDTAPITGEPVPVHVGAGDAVVSGCVNTSGQLTIRVEKPLSQSMVTRILDAVENAAASKPKIDRFITRFARVYTPVVVAAAAATAILPSLITGDWSYWVYTALSFLVMSCPCALVLSVPLAFFSGIGVGSKQGILFKGGLSIEAMANIKAVAMDKTGTVTKGDFVVHRVEGTEEMVSLCAGCEQGSTHPIAASIVEYARARKLSLGQPEDLEEFAGLGLRGRVAGKTVLCGSRSLMEKFGVALPVSLPRQAGTWVFVAVDGEFQGFLVISDTLKPGAEEAVARLKRMGVATAMLTGDAEESAQAVARAAGIGEVYAQLLPQEKLDTLRSLRDCHGATMFVGDGINDAPVLSGADVGAAMGSGADAAIEAADVVFMTSSVEAIPESLAIARRTRTIAWQNVIVALGVKAVVMLLGLTGHASMWMAVFADSGVAMLCVLNSIRLLYSGGKARR